MVRAVVKRDYAAVAFSSADRQSRCWDAQGPDHSVDIPAVSHLPDPAAPEPLADAEWVHQQTSCMTAW